MHGLSLEQHSTHSNRKDKPVQDLTYIQGIEATEKQPLESFRTTIASFHVSFQTCSINNSIQQKIVIQNLDTGSIKEWSKISDNELQDWMLETVDASFASSIYKISNTSTDVFTLVETLLEEIKSDSRPATIQIASIRIHQPELAQSPILIHSTDPLAVGTLMTDSPIEIELAVELVDSGFDPSLPLTYQVCCQAKHLATGMVVDLGDAQITADANTSTPGLLHLPKFVLQTPGAYRLMAFASLEVDPSVTTCLKVPGLQLQSSTPAAYRQSSTPAAYRLGEMPISCGI